MVNGYTFVQINHLCSISWKINCLNLKQFRPMIVMIYKHWKYARVKIEKNAKIWFIHGIRALPWQLNVMIDTDNNIERKAKSFEHVLSITYTNPIRNKFQFMVYFGLSSNTSKLVPLWEINFVITLNSKLREICA